MPRKHQQKKKSQRHRKGSYGGDFRKENRNQEISTSLEEDLRQQRIRQQEREKLRQLQDEKKRKENEADDEDCNHDVGFQAHLLFQNDHVIANGIARTNHLVLKGTMLPTSTVPTSISDESSEQSVSSLQSSVIKLPPSILFTYIEQASPLLSIHKRNKLRRLWSPQYHMESMKVLPRAASLYCKTKWPQHQTIESNSSLRCSWDLSCKQWLHPSARTFDIAMLSSESTPTIATIFQDGWGLLRQKSQHKINTIKAPTAYAIRMHEGSSLCGMVVRPKGSNQQPVYSSYSFRWYPLPHATSYVEANLPCPVSDFCFGKDIALFSRPKGNPLFLPLLEDSVLQNDFRYYDSAVRTLNVRNFPQSDALRIEMMCEQKEKLVPFGHRNGQVSILDLRASTSVCSILQCEASAASKTAGSSGSQPRLLGSVSDLGFLTGGNTRYSSSSGYRVLVKRSFGSCQLHDMRKASSSAYGSDDSHTSTTVVHNMCVPPNEINPMLTSNCNGFAVDPNSHQTMVSPYICSSSGDARLGVWSLETGHMVGSRCLLANHDQKYVGTTSTFHVEVCSRTTPLVQPNSNNSCDTSSFGIWLKCGTITSGKLRSKFGSLHQISIPGRWENNEAQNQSTAS